MEQLEKIDIIMERTGLGYEASSALLDAADGDVVAALIQHEVNQRSERPESPSDRGVLPWMKRLLSEGNATVVRVRRGDKVFLEIPLTAGVVGALIAPELAVIGGAASLFTRCTVEVERSDGSVESRDV